MVREPVARSFLALDGLFEDIRGKIVISSDDGPFKDCRIAVAKALVTFEVSEKLDTDKPMEDGSSKEPYSGKLLDDGGGGGGGVIGWVALASEKEV